MFVFQTKPRNIRLSVRIRNMQDAEKDVSEASSNLNRIVHTRRDRTHPIEWQIAIAVLREALIRQRHVKAFK